MVLRGSRNLGAKCISGTITVRIGGKNILLPILTAVGRAGAGGGTAVAKDDDGSPMTGGL